MKSILAAGLLLTLIGIGSGFERVVVIEEAYSET